MHLASFPLPLGPIEIIGPITIHLLYLLFITTLFGGIIFYVTLAWTLIKLLPEVIAWVKSHPFKDKKEVVYEFKDKVQDMMHREYSVGQPNDLKKL
jgi:hypothetical protein